MTVTPQVVTAIVALPVMVKLDRAASYVTSVTLQFYSLKIMEIIYNLIDFMAHILPLKVGDGRPALFFTVISQTKNNINIVEIN